MQIECAGGIISDHGCDGPQWLLSRALAKAAGEPTGFPSSITHFHQPWLVWINN
jgi:hypothetical protein